MNVNNPPTFGMLGFLQVSLTQQSGCFPVLGDQKLSWLLLTRPGVFRSQEFQRCVHGEQGVKATRIYGLD